MPQTFTLPNFYQDWPFPRMRNPHHASASAASKRWVEDSGVFNGDEAHADEFNRCDFPLLASLTYPRADPAHLRGACDLINWFFIFDELSDVCDGKSSRALVRRLTDIFRDPTQPLEGPSTLENVTESFWTRCLEYAHPTSAKRFMLSMESYTSSVCQEAEDRDHRRMRTVDEYLALRRDTVGARPSYYFLVLSKDLPEEVTNDPRVEELTRITVDLMIYANDVCSWNYERSHGLDEHNLVSVVMADQGLDVQDAIDHIGEGYHALTREFVEKMNHVPSFSEEIDPVVSEYVHGLGNWITGFLEWAFESERYFGRKGLEVKATGVVELLPRKLEEKL